MVALTYARAWGSRVRVRHFSRVVLHLTVHPRAALKGPRQPRCHARHVAASSARGVKALHRQHGSLLVLCAFDPSSALARRWGVNWRTEIACFMRGKSKRTSTIQSLSTGRSCASRYKSDHPDTPSLLTLAACTHACADLVRESKAHQNQRLGQTPRTAAAGS